MSATDRELRANLILQTAFTAVTVTYIAAWWQRSEAASPVESTTWLITGAVLGCLLALFQRHVRRRLGLAVLASVPYVLAAIWLSAGELQNMTGAAGMLFGFSAGCLHLSLLAVFVAAAPRGRLLLALLVYGVVLMAVGTGMVLLTTTMPAENLPNRWMLATAAFLTALCLMVIWHREALEQLVEVIIWPMYRIRGHGSGLRSVPLHGPLLIVANHAAWFDPMFLAKVLPRRLTPMMVSSFYDLPVLRWLMVHVVHAIRVQKSTYRREAPELQQAINMLDNAGCVVIFPEGGMRRQEAAPLRRFGQGIWHILRARPNTPVIVCWIEGNWGSYCSYLNGPPTKNKRPDFWRHIDVVVTEAQVTPPALLADQLKTRKHFMERCLQARTMLGLPAFSLPEMLADAKTDEANDSDAA